MMSEFVKEIREEMAQESEETVVSAEPEKEVGEKRCYTIDEIAIILGICRKTVYSLLRKNEFRWFRVGSNYRISKKSFDEWLDSNA